MSSKPLAEALEEARASGRVLLDLTETDPARCGLGWDPGELEAIRERRVAAGAAGAAALSEAREAIASYLAGHGASVAPDRILVMPTARDALRLVLGALCDGDGEALVPSPHRPFLEAGSPVHLRPYPLEFDETWQLARRSVQRAVTPGTRALVVGNPADPTGAELSRGELDFLQQLCASRGIALVADESFLDVSAAPPPTVMAARGCLAVHVSGLAGICGLRRQEAAWVAVGGPEELAVPFAARLGAAPVDPSVAERALLVPPLLGRREAYLSRVRARLARNRSALATAALAEAPWTMQWGGGIWAVLQVNPALDLELVCRALLEDGVAVEPAYLGGFPRHGHLLLSLLPTPAVFDAGLARIAAELRRPAGRS